MPLDPRDRVLVKLAVDVVRKAMETASSARGDTSAVRLALRVMPPHRTAPHRTAPHRTAPHRPERWPLTMFWEPAGQAHVIGRKQGMNAAYNGILRQLERSGAWLEAMQI